MLHKISILLTATINTNGMVDTLVSDTLVRQTQYEDALTFYLEKTDLPIVFAENSNTDISWKFQKWIDTGRLEYITFDGNNFDKNKGKGYGEALILLQAYYNSRIVHNSKYIIKITGRVKVININYIANSLFLRFDNVFRCDLVDIGFFRTVVFVATPQQIKKVFEPRLSIMKNESGYIFENIICKGILEDKNVHLIPFHKTPIIEGIFSSFGRPYTNKSNLDNVLDNYSIWERIEIQRESTMKAKTIKLVHFLIVLFAPSLLLMRVKRCLKLKVFVF